MVVEAAWGEDYCPAVLGLVVGLYACCAEYVDFIVMDTAGWAIM
jgi:hypothetical protein